MSFLNKNFSLVILIEKGGVMNTTRYKHFKGNEYRVVCFAVNSETKEELVVYKKSDEDKIWARPKSMFFEQVDLNGTFTPRFQPIYD